MILQSMEGVFLLHLTHAYFSPLQIYMSLYQIPSNQQPDVNGLCQ